MYKSKLQELCHKQKWALPVYTSMKDGPDHCPQFKASVVVSGLNFDTPTVCKSSKQAYNEAAKVAFLHFYSEPSNHKNEDTKQANGENKVQNSQTPSQDVDMKHEPSNHNNEDAKQANSENKIQNSQMPSQDVDMKHNADFPEEFKKKLEMYVKKKNLNLPVYSSEKESPNAPFFRGRVSIGEDLFLSEKLYNFVEEADDAAAQDALLSMTTDALNENDPNSYKNLLQELAEDEGFFLPKYTTIRTGGAHGQTFTSTVEVEGELFEGDPEKSRKLAELSAAKAAYTFFMERKLFQPGYFSLRPSSDNIKKLAPKLESLTISEGKENHEPLSNLSSSIETETESHKITGENESISTHSDSKSGNDKCTARELVESPVQDLEKLTGARKPDWPPEINGPVKKRCEMESYLLCNRVKVFTCIPEIALPKGTVLLPISENKWTMVTLEFPNEKCM